jgi:nicotinamidase-related amidase
MPVMALLDRDDSVLVVIDVQPGFLGVDADSAVARMAWLVAVAARLGVPVVATEEEPERNGPIDPRVAVRLPIGTQVLRKPSFALTGTPEILAAVRATGRTTAIVVGCETDVCVAQSAIGLREEGFACVVVEDATYSPGEMHERGLARVTGDGVARNHAKGVTYEWLRTVDDAHVVLNDPALPAPPFRL